MKFTGFIFVLPLLYADVIVFTAKKQSYLQDWFINENTIVLKNQTLIQCAAECGALDGCMSISYKRTTQDCLGVNNGYLVQPLTLGYDSTGWSYYLVLDERCPEAIGYVFSKAFNSCYKVHLYNTTLVYSDYSQLCESEGGELMKIGSQEKQKHIVNHLGQLDISDWIFFQGMHLLSETPWRYNDGSVISYFNWHPTQPDPTAQKPLEYLCMKQFYQYQWHDCWGTMKGAFICEIYIK
ncbi:CHODL [Mytilus coruscus]|uniref:CHODL n=1 Tax=Mytilus coruscus TaxID=42192 RepID=A0A6J8BZR1_MYTCO|nr:CHODL [Mytilus coruscus]